MPDEVVGPFTPLRQLILESATPPDSAVHHIAGLCTTHTHRFMLVPAYPWQVRGASKSQKAGWRFKALREWREEVRLREWQEEVLAAVAIPPA